MGANAQTTVPLFVSGQVLTAAQQNTSAGTGVPVFATTTTRDAAFGGSNKALAEGQLCYIEASDVVQYYTGAAWATVGPATAGALTFISATTIGSAVSSVTVSSAFSATYDNYKITVSGGTGSTAMAVLMTLGSTATGYYWGLQGADFAGTGSANGASNTSSWRIGAANTATFSTTMDLMSPNLAKNTAFAGTYLLPTTSSAGVMGNTGGFLNDTTSYTAFTITPATGTLTGGTIRVYGYSNS